MTSITEEECSICFEKLENEIAHLSCDHFFHYHCIGSWIQKKSNINSNEIYCPMCNQEFEIVNIYLPKENIINNNKIVKQSNIKIYNKNNQVSKSKCNIL
jgi:hypothetical protein